jgi:hypothetical protein
MAMTFAGFVKTGGVFVVSKNTPKQKDMISFTAVDELGNSYACQMWPDDPQFPQLAQVIGNARRQRVQFEVAGYSSRMRKFQDGQERPQTNFVVTRVLLPDLGIGA